MVDYTTSDIHFGLFETSKLHRIQLLFSM